MEGIKRENLEKIVKYCMSNSYAIMEYNLESNKATTLFTAGYIPELNNELLSSREEFDSISNIVGKIKCSDDIYEIYDGNMKPVFYNNEKWIALQIIVPENFSNDNQNIMLYINKLPPRSEAVFELQKTMDRLFVNSSLVNLEKDEITIVKKSKEKISQNFSEKKKNYTKTLAFIISELIYEDDREFVKSYLSLDSLKKQMKSINREQSIYYRRKFGMEYRWVRCIIMPSEFYSESNPVIMITTINSNTDALKYLAFSSKYEYQMLMERQNTGISENFYVDILKILNSFTEPYLFYVMVDLEADVYLSYKTRNVFQDPYNKLTNQYSFVIEKYTDQYFPKDVAQRIRKEATIDNIRKELTTKNTMQIAFEDSDGTPKVITITKMRSVNGVPTKVIITMTRDYENDRMLTIKTFGNFEVIGYDNKPVKFEKKQSKEVLAYMIDKKGYPITVKDIIWDILEKDVQDLNAQKYASSLIRKAIRDLEAAGYTNVIISENRTHRINVDMVDCDYYKLMEGNTQYWLKYKNEYMKEYSWAEETNAEIQHLSDE